jgi:hypothetical protein
MSAAGERWSLAGLEWVNHPIEMNRTESALVFVLFAAVERANVACGFGTDAATRLAYDVVENAGQLRQEGQQLTFTHQPSSWPEGCKSGYTIELQDSLHHPDAGGSLLVGCKDEANFRELGYTYSTTYHLNAARVPVAVRADKQPGEALQVTLAKRRTTVDVVGVK